MCLIPCGSDTPGNARFPAAIVSHPIMLNRVVIPEVCGPPGSPAGSWASAASAGDAGPRLPTRPV